MRAEPRYRWVGKLSRGAARKLLRGSRAMVLSSKLEGGANVISEAIALGVPVLASDIPGNVGLLGRDYQGYYPVGDTAGLANLLRRLESEDRFLNALRRQIRKLRPHFTPAAERRSWARLLKGIADEVKS